MFLSVSSVHVCLCLSVCACVCLCVCETLAQKEAAQTTSTPDVKALLRLYKALFMRYRGSIYALSRLYYGSFKALLRLQVAETEAAQIKPAPTSYGRNRAYKALVRLY